MSADIYHRGIPMIIIYHLHSLWLFRERMMLLLIFCSLMAVILSYFLLAPFYLEINSRKNIGRVRFHKLASARIYLSGESLFLELRIVGWHKTIDLLVSRENRVKRETKATKKRSISISIRKMEAVIKSFKLTKCSVSVDTGDMATNGILYPLFIVLSKLMKKDIHINFYGNNEFVIVAKNNFYRVLRAYIIN